MYIPILRCEFVKFYFWYLQNVKDMLFLRYEIVIIMEMWDWPIFIFVIWEKLILYLRFERTIIFLEVWDWFIIWYEFWDWERVLISWDKRQSNIEMWDWGRLHPCINILHYDGLTYYVYGLSGEEVETILFLN